MLNVFGDMWLLYMVLYYMKLRTGFFSLIFCYKQICVQILTHFADLQYNTIVGPICCDLCY
jgi:hypothetical protein